MKNKIKFIVKVWYWNWTHTKSGETKVLKNGKVNLKQYKCHRIFVETVDEQNIVENYVFCEKGIEHRVWQKQIKKIIIERV